MAADLVKELTTAPSVEVATKLAELVEADGLSTLTEHKVISGLTAAIEDAKAAPAREGGLLGVAELARVLGQCVEPFLIPLLPKIFDKAADKVAPVRLAAEKAAQAMVPAVPDAAIKVVVPLLLESMDLKKNWQTKALALQLLLALTKRSPEEIATCLPDIVPVASHCMSDAKPQVKDTAMKAMTEACTVCQNNDLRPFIPALIAAIAKPTLVPDTVTKLAATTFVQAVESTALSILVPLLLRGLRERSTPVRRRTAVIIDNMAKLVDDPNDAAVFLPKLLPGLLKLKEEVADPECRQVATKAHATLQGLVDDPAAGQAAKHADPDVVLSTLKEVVVSHAKEHAGSVTFSLEAAAEMFVYISQIATHLIDANVFRGGAWKEAVVPYLAGWMNTAAAEAVCTAFLGRCQREIKEKERAVDTEHEAGEDLCNCEFSLAYGGKILLNNAVLHLKRGARYGLCGPNGAGKSTLMRAIANGQLEGFPPKSELRTVYVEHDIDASESETAVVEYVYADPILQDASHPAHALVEETLASVGFTPEMQQAAVRTLSGGWKMKLALARAMLMKADILLLDEPTNHLDVTNVKWLETYLTGLKDVTSMVVSHDSGFLDNVCTAIIHYENRKLRKYLGNLSEFVKRRPEAKAYYNLEDSSMKFKFPEPGFLEGVKSKDKAILKMQHCHFTYPGAEKKTLEDVSIYCSLNSRVAVVGSNGAGKSTMIKLLCGEMEPQQGTVWKHPNLRIAYVAQHAFHHIEHHLDKTPNQYIQWRYASGEDREDTTKVTRQATEEEEKKMAQITVIDGVKRVVEKLLSRRKLRKSYEYEVQWKGCSYEQNSWLPRDKLEEMGFDKMLNELDAKEAARAGMVVKPLTVANIQKHLEDVGIDAEFGTHSHIRGLSGGQKVKVVLAAAMWNNPHLLVLDEPTNYLDRDSLGALASAIKDYGGGVVMISHNSEFTGALCPEQWLMAAGRLSVSGQPEAMANAAKLEWKREEETTDALGNVIKVKAPKKATLSNKEKKKAAKVRAARIARGEEVSDEDDDWE